MERSSNGVALTVGASLIWGTSFVAVSVGLEYSNPYTLLFERFLVATLAIVVVSAFVKSARIWPELPKPKTWILGGVYAAAFVLQFLGQNLSGASASALLSNLFVVFVPVVAFFVLRERIPNMSKAAVALSVLGVFLVFPSGLQVSASTLGDLLLVGSSLGYTLFIVYSKKFGVTSMAGSFAVIVSMTIIMAPVSVLAGGYTSFGPVAAAGWESVVWLGVPCTVVALAMYTRGLASIRAVQSATLLLFEIIVGVTLSVALLGSVLNSIQLIGAGVIAFAILLSSRP